MKMEYEFIVKFKTVIVLILTGLAFIGCQNRIVKRDYIIKKDYLINVPENIWVSDTFIEKADSIVDYYNIARIKLKEKDTLGAEIFYEQAFEILSNFSEGDRNTLQYWDHYDTLFMSLNDDYEKIYIANNTTMEAEEVREDIIEMVELDIPDSILFGEETVIDSSGDIPITINNKVRMAIKYFQTKGRVVFTRWLERSGKYEDLVREIFESKGVPKDLAYIAMIESGFNPSAQSYARAVGMWQFISATGRYYGLRHDWWFDERRDVVKSTMAAAEHLNDLYKRFGDWYLALAGYNCNPKKVEYNMRRYNTQDFWKLRRLPRQTRNYVPTYLAATIIAKNPKKFGFFIDKHKPIETDMVQISESVDLNVVANIIGLEYSTIKELNPAVLRWVTPPGVSDFNLYLPKGTKKKFVEGYSKIPDHQKRSWVRHRIKGGETLSTIAQKYHTSISVIRSTNKLRSNLIHEGKYLVIPVPQNKSHYYTYKENVQTSATRRSTVKTIRNVPGHKKLTYIVKKGDTLGEIAEIYNTRASKIRSWNGLPYGRHIYPNQKLTIWIPENYDKIKAKVRNNISIGDDTDVSYHIVKQGDTLWDIAKKYNLSISDLKKINKMSNSFIKPGDRLIVSKN
jgi:membrane-bound lytic murein transglycosylase D